MEPIKLRGPILALIFDLDDTLYPEVEYVRSGFRAVAGHLATPQRTANDIYERLWQTFQTGPRDRVFNEVLEQLGQPADSQTLSRLVEIYRNHKPTLMLEPVVRELLQSLRPRYPLGIITDGYLPAQRLKVEALGLEPMVDHVIYTESLGRDCWKPHPRAFELMSQTLGCPHPHCVYIADNPAKDFLAPNRLGWQTVQLNRPGKVHPPGAISPEARAHLAIDNISLFKTLLP